MPKYDKQFFVVINLTRVLSIPKNIDNITKNNNILSFSQLSLERWTIKL